jgi:hypothetical protein
MGTAPSVWLVMGSVDLEGDLVLSAWATLEGAAAEVARLEANEDLLRDYDRFYVADPQELRGYGAAARLARV